MSLIFEENGFEERLGRSKNGRQCWYLRHLESGKNYLFTEYKHHTPEEKMKLVMSSETNYPIDGVKNKYYEDYNFYNAITPRN